MKTLLLSMMAITTISTFATTLPQLHQVNTIKLKAPYSCNGSYKKSAIFLTDYSESRNSPDLLYNGACGSKKYIGASTAGDDFSLIADLGDIDIEKVTASKSFNFQRTVGSDNTFKESARLIKGHTYAVLTSKSDIRSLVIYKLTELKPNGEAKFEYSVKSYSIQESIDEAPGFSWEQESTRQ